MLIPVLFCGLAKKLFGSLALTVATAMIAGYVVSMTVTRWRVGIRGPSGTRTARCGLSMRAFSVCVTATHGCER